MTRTIFERVWEDPLTKFIYRNDGIGVGAIADVFPKVPDQVVIIPRTGFPDRVEAGLTDLPVEVYLGMMCVARAMMAKMESFSEVEGVRGVTHIEGFAVPNHPHVVMFPALRGESHALHLPSRFTNPEVRKGMVQATLRNLAFSPEEKAALDKQLG